MPEYVVHLEQRTTVRLIAASRQSATDVAMKMSQDETFAPASLFSIWQVEELKSGGVITQTWEAISTCEHCDGPIFEDDEQVRDPHVDVHFRCVDTFYGDEHE